MKLGRQSHAAARFHDKTLLFGTETSPKFARKSRNHVGLRAIDTVKNGFEIRIFAIMTNIFALT